MTLNQVLAGVTCLNAVAPGLLATEVTGLVYDSRKVERGYLFFAFSGAKTDGAQFANAALSKGALAVLADRPAPGGFSGAWIQVPQARFALAAAARNFFGRPDEQLGVTAVTGTNGKTTSTSLIDSILRAVGKTTALIGTIEYHLAGKVLPAVNTTPESLDLFRMFHDLVQLGGSHATLEASSHALDLGRIYGLSVHTAGWTNLTRDHLDYHQTMEAYFAAKQLLFMPRSGPPPQFAVLNADDEWARRLHLADETQVYWYTLTGERRDVQKAGAWLRALNVESGFDGSRFTIECGQFQIPIVSPLVGDVNVMNILLACGVALTYGIAAEDIQKGIAQLSAVAGRFERVDAGQPFMVIVDYAHTDDALRNVIQVARGMRPKRVITLFGCGGDRDRSKRPLMGMAAGELSDVVVLTSDNPRSEDPLAIMNDAMVGLRRFDTAYVADPDRERAIRKALETADRGDVVILAGKGHETYQILKDGPIPFDDREVARRVLGSLGYKKG